MADTAQELLALYERMALVRRTEQAAHDLFLSGLVKGTTHLAAGQEAIAVGASAALRADDYVFATYRGHHHALARGATPEECLVELGRAAVVREGGAVTLVALASMVPVASRAAEILSEEGIGAEAVDLRCLVPLDMSTVLASLAKTSRLVTVEENPYQGGWGGTLVSVVADEGFGLLDAPVRRVAGECVPLPFADALEEQVIPTVDKVVATVRALTVY